MSDAMAPALEYALIELFGPVVSLTRGSATPLRMRAPSGAAAFGLGGR